MPCPCGSTECSCGEKCFCRKNNCRCISCMLLSKICSRCSFPFQSEISKQSCEHQSCSCDDTVQSLRSATETSKRIDDQSTESERSCESPMILERSDKCPHRNLSTSTTSADDTLKRNSPYSSPQKKPAAKYPGTPSEHETSNSTSDHREISADRHVRKALSRKTRNEKSNWQAKKVKDCSSNSPDSVITNAEIADAEQLLNISCSSEGDTLEDVQSLNARLNRSRGFSFTQCSPGSLGHSESIRFVNLSPNLRARLPHPFPRLPEPIPGPPAFGGQLHQSPNLAQTFPTPRRKTPRPFSPKKHAKNMEKLVEKLSNALNTGAEYPHELVKEPMEVEQSSINPEVLLHCSSAAAVSNSVKDKEDVEPNTDTDRSTTLSKSHTESESD